MTVTHLDSFTFYLDAPTNVLLRGEVDAWDNTCQCATGPTLYERGATHTTRYHSGVGPYQPITFAPHGDNLTAGAQYVLVFTISKDNAADAPTAGIPGFVAVHAADLYPGGVWV